MRSLRLLLALLALSLFAGCTGPVGTYRVDSSSLLESSCGGIDAQRIQAWQAALDAAPASDLQIGSKGGETQAQLQRDDGSVLFASVGDNGDNTYVGTRFVEGTTTTESVLGSDFSGLLEVSGVCTFDLTVDVNLNFGEDGFDGVVADFTTTIEETDAAEACDIQTCRAVIRVGAGKTSSVNPGIQE